MAGKAWVGGVCNGYRTSINEDGAYFVTVSVAAHEIGHKYVVSLFIIHFFFINYTVLL